MSKLNQQPTNGGVWVACSERLPDEKHVDEHGHVMVLDHNGKVFFKHWSTSFKPFTHWLDTTVEIVTREEHEAEVDRLTKRIEELENKPIPMNDEIRLILGRPNFSCISIAEKLRGLGYEIFQKSEDEQAVVIHWMLNLYMKYGSDWISKGDDELEGKASKHD